jgi:excisionase family DNA binding protein
MPSAVTAIPSCLTVRELSRVLNCSEKTTLAMAKSGQIPCIEIGPRSRRFNLEHALAAAY